MYPSLCSGRNEYIVFVVDRGLAATLGLRTSRLTGAVEVGELLELWQVGNAVTEQSCALRWSVSRAPFEPARETTVRRAHPTRRLRSGYALSGGLLSLVGWARQVMRALARLQGSLFGKRQRQIAVSAYMGDRQ